MKTQPRPRRVFLPWVWALAILLAPIFSAAEEPASPAATPPKAADTRTVEQRLNALDTYLNQPPSPAPRPEAKGTPSVPLVVPRNSGQIAWVLLQAALMSLIAVGGLALFYGTLAGGKNVRNVCLSFLGCAVVVVVVWWVAGYSLAFGTSFRSPFLGGTEALFMKQVGVAPNTDYAFFISHDVFAIYQALSAVFGAAIVVAGLARRVKWRTLLLFTAPWVLLIYCPVAHMVWGANGLMNGLWNSEAKLSALDFAGGLVVHVTAGWSVLVFGLMLGLRPRWGRVPDQPRSLMRTIAGTALLWIGWLGYTISLTPDLAVAADGIATSVITARTMAAAVGGLVWVMLDVILRRPLPLRGFCLGIIAGLVAISPAGGFVTNTGAAIIALFASGAAYVFANYLTTAPGFEIARNVFAIHGAGGAVGVVLTALLADASVNGNLTLLPHPAEVSGMSGNAFDHPFLQSQLGAVLVTVLVSTIGTAVIAFVLKAVLKRPCAQESASAPA
ncbi:MAG TPA: hypothetical protein VGO11_26065 [Chthoniobacteraceae bacterium]|nr:hypothetical protein [Chthoniobacteraceae bacterium]